jgi:hypothetical protein
MENANINQNEMFSLPKNSMEIDAFVLEPKYAWGIIASTFYISNSTLVK